MLTFLSKLVYALLGTRKSRYIVFATLFFALLSTYVESGLQSEVDEHVNPYLSRAIISIGLTLVTGGCLKLLELLLARYRSGWWLYGLALETGGAPHFIVGYFKAVYDANTDRHMVRTAKCFDCDNVARGATLLDTTKPRATWKADKIWITEDHMDIVYNLEKAGPGQKGEGGAPDTYLGLILLQTDRESGSGDRYDGEVKYVQDIHGHNGYVYCEKIEQKATPDKVAAALIELELKNKKAWYLVDCVAKIHDEKKSKGNPPVAVGAH